MNAILEEKEKAAGWKSGFTNKTVWTYLYACFGLFLAKNFWFLEFTIVFNFDENGNKNLFKKKLIKLSA